MRDQIKLRQGKLAARRRRRAIFISAYSVFALGLVMCALSYLSQLPSMAIQTIAVHGNARMSAAVVESVAFKKLVGNYLNLFSKRNAFLYPKDEIARDVRALPLIKSADVARDGLTTIAVSVEERIQKAIWCPGSEPSGKAAGGGNGVARECYSVDENGFVFAPALVGLEGSTDLQFIYRNGLTRPDAASTTAAGPIGGHVLTPPQFKKIDFFMTELAGLSVEPREAILGDSTSSASYMTVALKRGGKLVINTSDDLSAVLGNIAAIITDRSVAPSLDRFLSTLDYMKLDVGNKVVYKLKDK